MILSNSGVKYADKYGIQNGRQHQTEQNCLLSAGNARTNAGKNKQIMKTKKRKKNQTTRLSYKVRQDPKFKITI